MELTKNFNELEFLNEDVKNAMIECNRLGYEIFISNRTPIFESDKKISYFHFKDVDTLAMGYCELSTLNLFNGWSFSTQHKPNTKTGSGWRVFSHVFDVKNEHFIKTIGRARYNLLNGETALNFELFKKEHFKIIFSEADND